MNLWSSSGYGGFGPGGHFICALTIANCRLPPASPKAYSNGDTPYLFRRMDSKFLRWNLRKCMNLHLSEHRESKPEKMYKYP